MSTLLTGIALGVSLSVVLGLLVAAVLSQRGDDAYERIDDQFGIGNIKIGRCKSCGFECNAGPVGSHGRTDLCYICSQEVIGDE